MSYPIRAILNLDEFILVGRGLTLLVFEAKSQNVVQSIAVYSPILSIKALSAGLVLISHGKSFRLVEKISNSGIERKSGFQLVGSKVHLKYWIIDVVQSKTQSPRECQLLLLLSPNVVLEYNVFKKEPERIWRCEVPCILYSGLLCFDEQNRLVRVFSGTVFNTVLVWQFAICANSTRDSTSSRDFLEAELCNSKTQCVDVSLNLIGHNGVIFDMDFDWSRNSLVTGSDDRSCRLWDIPHSLQDFHSKPLESVSVFFCHKARVQKVRFFGSYILSVGEDCFLCVLTRDALIAKFQAHKGLNIFAIGVSDKNFFLTAGEDGALLFWDGDRLNNRPGKSKAIDFGSEDYDFRLVKFVSLKQMIVLTMKGDILLVRVSDSDSEVIYLNSIECLVSYAVCDTCPSTNVVIFGSLHGDIVFLNFISKLERRLNLSCSKINSLKFINKSTILACAFDKLFLVCVEKESPLSVLNIFDWPITSNNWPNCSCEFLTNEKRALACGDRNGTIWVFEIENRKNSFALKNSESNCQVLTRAHSKLGVMDIVFNSHRILSSGRDGKINIYNISEDMGCRDEGLILQIASTIQVHDSIDWIAKLVFDSGKLFAFCFKSDNLVLVKVESSRSIAEIPCGGGHRSYDLTTTDDDFNFVYLKKSEVYFVEFTLSKGCPFKTILSPLHGMKIHCVEIINVHNEVIVLTGSEDNCVKISWVQNAQDHFIECLGTIDTSPCSVRAMKVVKKTDTKVFLLIAGSRSLKALYELTFSVDIVHSKHVSVRQMCFDCSSKVDNEDDCKYLSIDSCLSSSGTDIHVVFASSHGHLTLETFDTESKLPNRVRKVPNRVQMQSSTEKTIFSPEDFRGCQSKTGSINVAGFLSLDTTSSEASKPVVFGDNFGYVRVLGECKSKSNKYAISATVDLSDKLGRITCMDIEGELILAGGDSGSLVVLLIENESRLCVAVQAVIEQCHAAQIVACHWLTSSADNEASVVASVSIDQSIKAFSLKDATCSLQKRREHTWTVKGEETLVCHEMMGIEDPSCSSLLMSQILFQSPVLVTAGHGVALVPLNMPSTDLT